MESANYRGKRVLLIDDNIVTREMMSLVLAGEGYRVATACNGADALDRLHGYERPDLILLDLRLPVMDGCTFCERRKRDPDLVSIPLVVVSALADVADQAAAVGATAYLQKPVDPITLLDAVRHWCPCRTAPAGA